MSNEIFNTSIIRKQLNILESKLKSVPDCKELVAENKKLKNQVNQLKDYSLHLKQRIKDLEAKPPITIATLEDEPKPSQEG